MLSSHSHNLVLDFEVTYMHFPKHRSTSETWLTERCVELHTLRFRRFKGVLSIDSCSVVVVMPMTKRMSLGLQTVEDGSGSRWNVLKCVIFAVAAIWSNCNHTALSHQLCRRLRQRNSTRCPCVLTTTTSRQIGSRVQADEYSCECYSSALLCQLSARSTHTGRQPTKEKKRTDKAISLQLHVYHVVRARLVVTNLLRGGMDTILLSLITV
ncbi:hypothetical protein V8B97DRAFT_970592 [Scleroderma yunnanense]